MSFYNRRILKCKFFYVLPVPLILYRQKKQISILQLTFASHTTKFRSGYCSTSVPNLLFVNIVYFIIKCIQNRVLQYWKAIEVYHTPFYIECLTLLVIFRAVLNSKTREKIRGKYFILKCFVDLFFTYLFDIVPASENFF